MKHIAQAVHAILRENRECTYQFICQSISAQNNETATRRIYDVLNVMRAVNLVGKKGKLYFLLNNSDNLKRKKAEIKKLEEMVDTFKFITTRNELMAPSASEKLYLPFMIISTEKKSEIHCDTNEERTFFNFRSNRPLKVLEDLDVLKEIRNQSREDAKKYSQSLSFDAFTF